jgi:hypothetical protein
MSFCRHVGRHQQQLAVAAIPQDIEGLVIVDDDENNDPFDVDSLLTPYTVDEIPGFNRNDLGLQQNQDPVFPAFNTSPSSAPVPPLLPPLFHPPGWSDHYVPPSPAVREQPGVVCPTCNQPVKNRADLKRHEQRHQKPHKCDIEGCGREEGFTTLENLERHKRNYHWGPRYKCTIGVCAAKDKLWPRRDNFRSHLKRVHGIERALDDELMEFVVAPPLTTADELAGVGSSASGAEREAASSILVFDGNDQAVPLETLQANSDSDSDLEPQHQVPLGHGYNDGTREGPGGERTRSPWRESDSGRGPTR